MDLHQHKVQGIAQELEKTELQRELDDLWDERNGLHGTSSEDSEFIGYWRIDPEELKEWGLEEWGASEGLESAGKQEELEGEMK